MAFGRRTATQAPIEASSEVCITDDSCAMDRLVAERHLVETLDEREAEQLEQMVDLARSWETIGSNISQFINQRRINVEMGDVASAASRSDRRNSDRTRESWLMQNVATAHNDAMADFKKSKYMAPIYTDNLVADGAPSSFLLKGVHTILIKEHNTRVRTPGALDTTFLKKELVSSFQFEYLIRGLMQRINEDNPDVLQTVFDPATLKDLPVSLQRIAALDIGLGKGQSVLLDNAQKTVMGEQTPAERLAEYIKSNNLPEPVRRTLLSVKMGMKVMGAPECPFNEMGICTHALARLPEDQYPEEIRRDIANRNNSEAQNRIAGLTTFAQRTALSKVLNSHIEFNLNTTAHPSQQRKRTSTATTLDRRDMTMVETIELETPAFERVVIRVANEDVVFEMNDLGDAEQIRSVVEQLMGQKLVKKYTDTYRDPKLNATIENAIKVIATRKNYKETDRTITPWIDMKNKAMTNADGVKERYMRYSGSRATGVSGGPVGRQTRVIFSHGTKDGTRHVTIHKVIHKADLKSNPTLHR